MKVWLLTFLLVWSAESQDDIRAEIEEAALDSALLAEELAKMLARLEGKDQEDEGDQDTISVVATELERALQTTEELGEASLARDRNEEKQSGKDQRARKPKQDFGFVEKLLDVLEETPVFSEDFGESGQRQSEEERSSRTGVEEQEEQEEECEETTPTENVTVCLPGLEVKPSNLYFASQETYEEKYCYTKTQTQCDIKSTPAKRKVCTYKYLQKDHNVPATNVQVSFERSSEKMGVTNCKHIKNEYGDIQEVCKLELSSFHYKLPVVREEVLELVPVLYPEPEEECLEVETAEIDTECQHQEDDFCLSCSHIRDSSTQSETDQVYLSSYGQCEQRELSLPQTNCVREHRIQTVGPQRRPHYGPQHRPGYGSQSAFTAFQ